MRWPSDQQPVSKEEQIALYDQFTEVLRHRTFGEFSSFLASVIAGAICQAQGLDPTDPPDPIMNMGIITAWGALNMWVETDGDPGGEWNPDGPDA